MVKFIRYNKLFRFYEAIQPMLKYSLKVEENLPGDKMLVIAPHPDDEVIGCAGVMSKYKSSGKTVKVLYCTKDSNERINEAKNASELLKVDEKVFWDYKIESISKQGAFREKLKSLLEHEKPDIVLLPFWLDNHTDHRAINEALVRIGKTKSFDFMVYAYPVWFPVYPNLLVDISSVWEQKVKAIKCYSSQLATRDYVKMSKALCEYWATVKGRDIQYAESFFRATFKEYVNLGKKILRV